MTLFFLLHKHTIESSNSRICNVYNYEYATAKLQGSPIDILFRISQQCSADSRCTWLSQEEVCHPISDAIFDIPGRWYPQTNQNEQNAYTFFSDLFDDAAPCYAIYSSDGCPKCIARGKHTCGWCSQLGVCAEGDKSGSQDGLCSGSNWIFNQSVCDSKMCSSFKSKESCRQPCSWSSIRGKCTLPFSLKKIFSNGETSSTKQTDNSQTYIIISCVLAGVIVVVAIGGFIWRKLLKTNNYAQMGGTTNLNDIPSVL